MGIRSSYGAFMSLPDAPSQDLPTSKPPRAFVPLSALYNTFFWIGLFSFGGGLSAWTHREMVQIRGWMTNDEFFSGYSLAQVLPGVNSTNLTVYVGQQLRGGIGAAVALAGMLTGPFVVVLAAAVTYEQLNEIPGFQVAMQGVAAAAIGLLIRMVIAGARNAARGIFPVIVILGTFAAVGIFKLPLLLVAVVAAPLSVYAAWPGKAKPDA
jgi:chromate transporter